MAAFLFGLMLGGALGYCLCALFGVGGEEEEEEIWCEAFNKGYSEGKTVGYKKGREEAFGEKEKEAKGNG